MVYWVYSKGKNSSIGFSLSLNIPLLIGTLLGGHFAPVDPAKPIHSSDLRKN